MTSRASRLLDELARLDRREPVVHQRWRQAWLALAAYEGVRDFEIVVWRQRSDEERAARAERNEFLVRWRAADRAWRAACRDEKTSAVTGTEE
jgi:hypothetical protein